MRGSREEDADDDDDDEEGMGGAGDAEGGVGGGAGGEVGQQTIVDVSLDFCDPHERFFHGIRCTLPSLFE